MSFFALLLLFQSAAAPPAPQHAQEASPEIATPEQTTGGLFGPSGKRDGRRGNDLYREEAYADAAAAYAGGIAILSDDAAPRLRYGLHNNLAAALLKSGNVEAARETFEQAMAEARESGEDMDLARTAYNAGNAAFAAQDLESALAHYRRSLLRNPDNEDARFNYEFVKRQMEAQEEPEGQEQQDQQQQDQDQQESDDENSENGQNESPQDENEAESPQNEQNRANEQQEQSGENEPQPNESPQEQAQDSQDPSSGEQPLSQAQAERMLEALEQEEGNLLRERQRTPTRPQRVEKDW